MAERGASRSFFDLWSRTYYNPVVQAFTYRPVQDAVIAALRDHAPDRVLDVGWGTGLFSTRLSAELRVATVGVDYSWGMIDQASRHSRARRGQADAMALPIASGAVDAIVCTESFHWYPDQARALKEFERVLRPGGRIYVALINPATERISEWTRRWSQRPGSPSTGRRASACGR